MHVGGVRTALFAWLIAKQSGGQFILRIEDTDKLREVEGSVAHIMKCLGWLGLIWDEGPDIGGPYAPYRQSEKLDVYKQWGQKLVDSGRAYADPYSPQELEVFRQKAKDEKRPFLFRDHRPENPKQWDGRTTLRFRSEPKNGSWNDAVMGASEYGPESIDDYILIKSDGYPTYNFAHIIDDHLMEITHVMRSQEFLPSTPRFLNLYEALEIKPPIIATLPFVLGAEGNKKLSKRDGAKDILDYRSEGYLPEVLVNFMASLGWNDGTEQEIFSIEELKSKFSLDRVQRSGARFDEQRLLWMNGQYIRNLSLDELAEQVEQGGYWSVASTAGEDYRKNILALVQERLKLFGELDELTVFFFKKPADKDVKQLYDNPVDKQLKKTPSDELRPSLEKTIAKLQASDFSHDELQTKLNELLQELSLKPSVLFPIIRIALTGSAISPEIFGTLSVLGKDESLARLNQAISLLDQPG